MKIKYYENDLPENLDFGDIVAIDTETMGLNPARDKLCLVQLSSGNGICHLVKILDLRKKPKNLIKLLKNNNITKADVQYAHKKIQKKIHPDISPETSRLSTIVNEAKDIILKNIS